MENTSTSNASFLGPNPVQSYAECLITRPSSIIYTVFIAIEVFLFLPLFIFILFFGLQQWRKKRSNSSALSHSDCFTYHLVLMELAGVLGCIITFGGIYGNGIKFVKAGSTLFSFTWYGQGFFHILTCVEHYLAVVHPVTYLMLRQTRGIRIRNVVVGCVWLLSFSGLGLAVKDNYIIMDSLVIILTTTITPFCSLSVISALTRSGQGEQGTRKERVVQSKQRAFYTIVAVLLVLLLRLAWSVAWIFNTVRAYSNCVVMTCEVLFNLPSNLVLPLLFLQRAGKLVSWENSTEGQG
ncbi:uncharacterized protein [Nothobranchius furzeri]